MMGHTATVTGNHGPGLTMTAKVFDNVTGIEWDFTNNVLNLEYGSPARNIRVALTGVTTITHTISGGQHTLTVS